VVQLEPAYVRLIIIICYRWWGSLLVIWLHLIGLLLPHLFKDLFGLFVCNTTSTFVLLYSANICNLLPLMLRICSILIMSACFEWGPWGNNGSGRWLCTIVYWLITYSSVFVGAHTLLGTVTRLFNPASVHWQTCGWLTLDNSAGGLRAPLFWPMRAEPIQPDWSASTNHRAWKVPRGERERGKEREREGEISETKEAPLLRRVALKSQRNFYLT
jgi:hypothetical protein